MRVSTSVSLDDALIEEIKAHLAAMPRRKRPTFSRWVEQACEDRLEGEKSSNWGLTPVQKNTPLPADEGTERQRAKSWEPELEDLPVQATPGDPAFTTVPFPSSASYSGGSSKAERAAESPAGAAKPGPKTKSTKSGIRVTVGKNIKSPGAGSK